MLLSCGNGLGRTFLARGQHGVVDLAGDVSLYAAHDFGFCPAFSNAAGEVVARGLVAAESNNADDVQGAVGVAVPASVESVPHGFSAGCFDERDTERLYASRDVSAKPFSNGAAGFRMWGAVIVMVPLDRERFGRFTRRITR